MQVRHIITYFALSVKNRLILFALGFENHCHNKGKNNRRGNPCARRRQCARERAKKSLLRALNRSVCEQVPEP